MWYHTLNIKTDAMPRQRRYGAKFSSKRRAPVARRKANLSLKRTIKRVVLNTAEDKIVCTDTTPQSLTSGTWYSTPCFQIGQGDDVSQRDGGVIMGNYGKIRMAIVSPTDRVAFLRLMLIRWKGTKGAFSTGVLPSDHLDCVLPHMRAHYTVLRDEVIALNPRTTGVAEDSRVIFKQMFFRDKNKKVYDASTVTTAEKGQVYLCALHGSAFAGGTDDCEIDAKIEYHFKDV